MRVLVLWMTVLALGCGGKTKEGGEKAPSKSAMTAMAAMGSAPRREPPARRRAMRPVARRASVAKPAGTAKLFYRWTKEMLALYKTTRAARKKKDWKAVIPVLTQGLGKQPENLDYRYARAWMRAQTGDTKGALADLEFLLYAHYPKYSRKAATDKDLAPLHKAPHKAKLEALLKAALEAHQVAWAEAVFFLGGGKRAYGLGQRIAGSQEVYGYVPRTGRYVGVSFVGRANVLGYFQLAQLTLAYATASTLVPDSQPKAYADLAVEVLSLETGKVLKRVAARKGERQRKPGIGWLEVEQRDDGVVFLRFDGRKEDGNREAADALAIELERSGGKLKVKVMNKDDVGPEVVPHDPDADPPDPVVQIAIRPCGAQVKRTQARAIREETVGTLGADKRAVKCPGLIWRHDSGVALYQPYRYCKNKPHEVQGLYLVRKGGAMVQLTPEHEARDLRWLADGKRALLQVGHRLGFVDVAQGRFTLLTPGAAFLSAYAPRLAPCAK